MENHQKVKNFIKKFPSSEYFFLKILNSLNFPYLIIDIKTKKIDFSKDFQDTFCYNKNLCDQSNCQTKNCPIELIKKIKHPTKLTHNKEDKEIEIYSYPIFNNKKEPIKLIQYYIESKKGTSEIEKFQEEILSEKKLLKQQKEILYQEKSKLEIEKQELEQKLKKYLEELKEKINQNLELKNKLNVNSNKDLEERLKELQIKLKSNSNNEEDLTKNEKLVLYGLCKYPSLNDEDISNELNIKRSTFTGIKNKLKDKFLIEFNLPNFAILNYSGFKIKTKNNAHQEQNNKEFPLLIQHNKKRLEITISKSQNIEKGYLFSTTKIKLFNLGDLLNYHFNLNLNKKTKSIVLNKKNIKLNKKEKQIFTNIIKNPAISLKDLTEKTNISKPTIIKIKKKLIKESIILPLRIPQNIGLNRLLIIKTKGQFNHKQTLIKLESKDIETNIILLKDLEESKKVIKKIKNKGIYLNSFKISLKKPALIQSNIRDSPSELFKSKNIGNSK